MKRKEKEELHTKAQDDLKKILYDKRVELSKMKLDASMRKLVNTASLKSVKKDIARILTVLSNRKEEKKSV